MNHGVGKNYWVPWPLGQWCWRLADDLIDMRYTYVGIVARRFIYRFLGELFLVRHIWHITWKAVKRIHIVVIECSKVSTALSIARMFGFTTIDENVATMTLHDLQKHGREAWWQRCPTVYQFGVHICRVVIRIRNRSGSGQKYNHILGWQYAIKRLESFLLKAQQ